jgi:hypothetical protein
VQHEIDKRMNMAFFGEIKGQGTGAIVSCSLEVLYYFPK